MRYVPGAILNLYRRTPVPLRSIASTLYGAVKNHRENTQQFWEFLGDVNESQWWSFDKLAELQQQRLRDLVRHAAARVPYYKRLFAEHGISPAQIQTIQDLKIIPTLSKDTVRTHARSLIADGLNLRKLRPQSTSGTTGSPLTVWMDDHTCLRTKAVQYLQHEWAGYRHDRWVGVLAGYKVVPLSQRNPPFWVKNYLGKQVHFSTYHLTLDHALKYLKEMASSDVQFLIGYPSAIGLLARVAGMANQVLPLKGVFLSSEPIFPWQRTAIKEAFECPIYDFYGQAEMVVNAISCGQTENLHICIESGVAEFIKHDFSPNRHVLIGTSLANYVMPLIRYELHDITSPVRKACSCGRTHLLMTPVETKSEDFIVTPEGLFVSASLLTFPFKDARAVSSCQIVQPDTEHIVVRIVPTEYFSQDESSKLIEDLRKCVGDTINIQIQPVNEISRTKDGKFRFVVSDVSRKQLGL
jgi:phenylacetate-CoA ligase